MTRSASHRGPSHTRRHKPTGFRGLASPRTWSKTDIHDMYMHMHMTVVFPRGRPRESVASNHHKPSLPTSQTPSTAPAAAPPSCHQSSTRPPSCSCFNYINGLEFRDQPSCAKYDNTISAPTSSTNHPDPLAAPIRPVESQRWRPRAHTPVPSRTFYKESGSFPPPR